MKKTLLWAGGVILVLALAEAGYLWSCYAPMMSQQRVAVGGQMTVLLGGGGNSVVLVSRDKSRVVVVDTKMRPAALKLRAFIDSLAPGAIVTIINTHNHPDHAAGNADILYHDAIAGAYTNEQWHGRAAHAPVPDIRIAPDEGRVLMMDGETIETRNMGVAHTRNDVIVYLHNRKTLITGDLVVNGWHPVVDRIGGADTRSWVKVLDKLLSEYEIASVVPGHGPMAGWELLAVQRDYFQLIREGLSDPAALAKARRLFADYRGLPGMSGSERTVASMRAEQ
jgi:cyclase